MSVDKAQIDLLKGFVTLCKGNPGVLNMPELAFYKEYLLSLGATIPEASAAGAKEKESKPKAVSMTQN